MSALRHGAHMFVEPNHNHSHFILCSPFQSFTPLLSSLRFSRGAALSAARPKLTLQRLPMDRSRVDDRIFFGWSAWLFLHFSKRQPHLSRSCFLSPPQSIIFLSWAWILTNILSNIEHITLSEMGPRLFLQGAWSTPFLPTVQPGCMCETHQQRPVKELVKRQPTVQHLLMEPKCTMCSPKIYSWTLGLFKLDLSGRIRCIHELWCWCQLIRTWVGIISFIHEPPVWVWVRAGCWIPWVCWISCCGDEAGLLVACEADWAAAQGDVMGCRNSKVLPEPPGDVQLDLVKKVSKTMVFTSTDNNIVTTIDTVTVHNSSSRTVTATFTTTSICMIIIHFMS